MIDSLSEVEGSIIDVKTELEELDTELQNLHWEVFDKVQDNFNNLHSEIDNLVGLFDDADVVDDKGMFSKEALSNLGLLTQKYELAQYQSSQYAKEIEKLNQDYLDGKYSLFEYQEKLASLNESQWDSINAAEQVKDAIMELNEARVEAQIEGIEEEIDTYKELIDAKIAALDAEKDLESYRRSIQDKSGNITDLERKIAAMANDSSSATIAERLRLEEELAEAKADLENFEYDHSIETQKNALNEQFTNFEAEKNEEIEALRATLENEETLIAQSFETVKQNASLVGQQISQTAKEHGIQVSDALTTSWKQGENAIATYGATLTTHSSAFIGNIANVEKQAWDLQEQANQTSSSLANMFSTQADNLVTELTESYTAEWNLASMTNALQQSLVNTLEGGYDVSSITSALGSVESAATSAKAAIDALNNTSINTSEDGKKFYEFTNPTTGEYVTSGNMTEEEAKKLAQNMGGLNYKAYAKGTRGTEGELIIKNEEGYELTLPKLSSGNYALTPEGSQILTKAQTDNIFDWSKINPDILIPQGIQSSISSLPQVTTRNISNNSPSIHLDKLIHIDKVDSANIGQMERIANKACDRLVEKMNFSLKYH